MSLVAKCEVGLVGGRLMWSRRSAGGCEGVSERVAGRRARVRNRLASGGGRVPVPLARPPPALCLSLGGAVSARVDRTGGQSCLCMILVPQSDLSLSGRL